LSFVQEVDMHLHHTPQHCDTCDDWPEFARYLAAGINHIIEQQERIMTDQDRIDADVTALTNAEQAIAAEVADLKAQIAAGTTAAALDFSGLDAIAAKLTADEPAPAAPADPAAPAAVDPNTPVITTA
jgi:primosomal protein N'